MNTVKDAEELLKDSLEYVKEKIILRAGTKFAALQAKCKQVNGKDVLVGNRRYELQNLYGTISITDKAICSSDTKRLLLDAIDNMIADISGRIGDALTMLDCNQMCLYELCDWTWLKSDKGEILKPEWGRPWYNATLVKYAVLAPKGGN